MKFLKTAICATAIMCGANAMAEGVPGVEVSGNVALGSEYFSRGYDESRGEALSGGFDIAFDNGLYAGTWGSTVDSSTSAGGIELDYYLGFGGSLSEDLTYDVGYIFYGYPNDIANDFEELYGSISYGDVTVGFVTSSDWFAGTGSYDYVYADYGMSLNEDYSLGFHYGTSSGADDYDDYAISLSTEAVGLGFDLSWISTDIAAGGYADNEFVLTVSRSM
jgi:uncharacterized protein (TIGR02001 family)